MKNTHSISPQQTEKSTLPGSVLFGATALGLFLLGITAFFEIGLFKEPGSIELAGKIFVGIAVLGFFLVIFLELLSELSLTINQSMNQNKA